MSRWIERLFDEEKRKAQTWKNSENEKLRRQVELQREHDKEQAELQRKQAEIEQQRELFYTSMENVAEKRKIIHRLSEINERLLKNNGNIWKGRLEKGFGMSISWQENRLGPRRTREDTETLEYKENAIAIEIGVKESNNDHGISIIAGDSFNKRLVINVSEDEFNETLINAFFNSDKYGEPTQPDYGSYDDIDTTWDGWNSDWEGPKC